MTLTEFIDLTHLRMRTMPTDRNPHMDSDRPMDHWRCTLTAPEGRRMVVTFSMGVGHGGSGNAPTLQAVLGCLASDSASVDDNAFEDWCAELGYDTDSCKARRVYTACEKQAARLRRLLGPDDYLALLYETEGN